MQQQQYTAHSQVCQRDRICFSNDCKIYEFFCSKCQMHLQCQQNQQTCTLVEWQDKIKKLKIDLKKNVRPTSIGSLYKEIDSQRQLINLKFGQIQADIEKFNPASVALTRILYFNPKDGSDNLELMKIREIVTHDPKETYGLKFNQSSINETPQIKDSGIFEDILECVEIISMKFKTEQIRCEKIEKNMREIIVLDEMKEEEKLPENKIIHEENQEKNIPESKPELNPSNFISNQVAPIIAPAIIPIPNATTASIENRQTILQQGNFAAPTAPSPAQLNNQFDKNSKFQPSVLASKDSDDNSSDMEYQCMQSETLNYCTKTNKPMNKFSFLNMVNNDPFGRKEKEPRTFTPLQRQRLLAIVYQKLNDTSIADPIPVIKQIAKDKRMSYRQIQIWLQEEEDKMMEWKKKKQEQKGEKNQVTSVQEQSTNEAQNQQKQQLPSSSDILPSSNQSTNNQE